MNEYIHRGADAKKRQLMSNCQIDWAMDGHLTAVLSEAHFRTN